MTDVYPKFGKIPRFHKDVVISEKIDGTNGLISIREGIPGELLSPGENAVYASGSDSIPCLVVRAGSRNRWLTPESDNYGFANWVAENATQLAALGVGNHYGEWFGSGVQRGYGLNDRQFALFNVARWFDPEFDNEVDVHEQFPNANPCPPCCTVVPVLWIGTADRVNNAIWAALMLLREGGSVVKAGFDRPEGVIVYHCASGQYYKVLLEGDNIPKSAVNTVAGEVIST